MKFLSSLKAWKKRGNIKQIRRGKQVILIDPDNPKFKAKQGFKKKKVSFSDEVSRHLMIFHQVFFIYLNLWNNNILSFHGHSLRYAPGAVLTYA